MRWGLFEFIIYCHFNIFIYVCLLIIIVYYYNKKKQTTTNKFWLVILIIKTITRIIVLFTIIIIWFSIRWIVGEVKWLVVPLHISPILHERILKIIKVFHLATYSGGEVFYILLLLLSPISSFLIVEDKENWVLWYVYYSGFSLLICVITFSIFTDSFFVVCILHTLICCILFYLLEWSGKIKIPDIVWIYFWLGFMLVMIGALCLYLKTGNFFWSITNGLQIVEPVRSIIQCFLYIGFSFPLGLWSVYNRTLGRCKFLPDSFLVFFNCILSLYYIFLVTCVHNLLLGTALNSIFLIFLILSIIVLTFYLYAEVKFRVIVGYMAAIHLNLLVFIYLFDSLMICNSLVYDIWYHIWCIASFYISLARFARCYGECITTANEGLFYKYPGTTLLNIVSLGLFVRIVVKFIYVIFMQSNWAIDNFLLLSLLIPVTISLTIYLFIILYRWSRLWFKIPKYPDNHIPQWFTWQECISIAYLILVAVGFFLCQLIFYW